MQRTAQNYAAYDQSQRSSRVTADVVYRLGRVPKPVDIKTAIGTMPRRQRGRGRRSQYGGVLELTDVVMQDLRSYAKQEKLDVPIGTKAALVAGLTELGVVLSDLEGTLGRAPKVSQVAQRRELFATLWNPLVWRECGEKHHLVLLGEMSGAHEDFGHKSLDGAHTK